MADLEKQSVILLRRRRALVAPSLGRTLTGGIIEFDSAAFQPFNIQNADTDLVYHASKNMSNVGAFNYPDDGAVCVIFDGIPPGQTYNASAHRDSVTTSGNGIRLRFQYEINGETIYDSGGYGTTGWMTKSCAIPSDATNARVVVQRATAVSAYEISSIQLELGGSRTVYAPFHLFETGRGVKTAVPGHNVVWSASGSNSVTFCRYGWQGVEA